MCVSFSASDIFQVGGDLEGQPNSWDPRRVLSMAWKQMNSKADRSGVDGTHRSLGILSTVASAFWQEQKNFIALQMNQIMASKCVPVVNKFYDATPIRCWFGRLSHEVMPHARYPVCEDGRWRLVRYEEYVRLNPSSQMRQIGTLELLAQGTTCRWMTGAGEAPRFQGPLSTENPSDLQCVVHLRGYRIRVSRALIFRFGKGLQSMSLRHRR